MEKTEKKTIEETKDNEIVELKDEDMSTITAGAGDQDSRTPKNVCNKKQNQIPVVSPIVSEPSERVCNKNVPDKHDLLSEF
ncbi:MAG: hypothetical protein MJ250_08750 [Alphaproteobacteria bacterium]|nr:hypothetical protein [Alphaproteobacteria bacterium]